MDLETSIKGMLDAQAKLREPAAIANPQLISDQMYRLAQYTAAAEHFLAELERDYEELEANIYRKAMREDKLSASAAEKQVKIDLGDLEGKIKYLTRIIAAAWKLHMSAMAKVKHLESENRGAI